MTGVAATLATGAATQVTGAAIAVTGEVTQVTEEVTPVIGEVTAVREVDSLVTGAAISLGEQDPAGPGLNYIKEVHKVYKPCQEWAHLQAV